MPDGPTRGADDEQGLGPHRQCEDQARHNKAVARLALRRLEGGARNGNRGVGEGGRGAGLTINIVNPGAGANTPGMGEEIRTMSREGRASRLVEPDEMVPPLLCVVSREADNVNSWRFGANLWDTGLLPAEAARPAGFDAPTTALKMSPPVIRPGSRLGAGRHRRFSRGAPHTEETHSNWRMWHAIGPMSSTRALV